MSSADPAPGVLIPAGPPLRAAASWVGRACWSELRLVEVLSGWLDDEPDPERALLLWHVRAETADRAQRWHRLLPELREMPRAGFVAPASAEVEQLFDEMALVGPGGPGDADRGAVLRAALRGLRLGYHRHQAIAVGPADGPVAVTLVAALRSTFDTLDDDPDPAWAQKVVEAGGLP